ncbi:hypothetical protein COW36_11345 [bacterium (Candidatus Blackallbacteria) CG17_big_fil_post_rev_8_21_14_2_50_48_46]|uniref:Alpha-ketoglutarate-dependent dioxygenase AlkB-like domain-containing protein n=1 Tax=bacterium (Candidatus Blackallbacteria) CG17_big_fil_post_rev_8_21_14_2_50_48_46 TaxID=2014261 RepID=A0A2M7G528_9BACT|nr:MAG: hypothetical protein COW64_18440 [bacterium (Candidatus Blackallbacteria) CG18_big_fil_WC_8_21_14_2_50_49_26]PIW16891.1 MAG: hypothetical protein COW36_11345 [bacterium (Candidatus Blackallbacteria) CG17_big_fil_post_rev_8_21_14_2_50_48_46]PIW48087.1 MAG: hypothetical protein COW20_11060 [bacterium (Candidatus Blackallbacteria) CG13_big_fil_rev_8_21_14_2_50_49_14]
MNQGDYLAPVCHSKDAFLVYDLPPQDNLFEALKAATRFEMQGKGRQGGLLVLPNSEDLFPLVRTTAEFQFPAQIFAPVHEHLAQMILERTSLTSKFNNALIEIYNKAYTQMGSHSDLALDLERDSWIALYSCYQNPEQAFPLRKLVIEAKATGEIFEIALKHHCVVIFSVATNRLFRHKIMLEKTPTTPENNWLGVTFRSAKTFVNYRSAPVQLADGQQLHLATPEERQAFLAWRRRENQEMDFDYPALNFTLSPSDLLTPELL